MGWLFRGAWAVLSGKKKGATLWNSVRQSGPARYGMALLSVLLLCLIERMIQPIVGEHAAPFLLSPIAVSVSAWFGGLGPGLLATALTVLVGAYFLPPAYSLSVERSDIFQLVATFVAGVAISFFTLARDRARSEMRRADLRSADAVRRWEYVFEQAGWGIVIVGPAEYRIRAVNTTYAHMHGYTQQELINRPVEVTIAPESRRNLEFNIRTANESGHHIYESVHLRKDGSTFPVLIDFAVLKDENGNILLGAAYCQDITARKQLEQKVREAQKLESLGVLAAGIAHDFNNLLVSILGNASLAIEAAPPDSDSRANLSEIIRASEKAADLTRQMLAYSGKGRFVIQHVNLSKEIREISQLLQESLRANVHLEFDLDNDVPPIDADPTQMQQVVFNLVTNAAEAIGDQPGKVTVRTHAQTLTEKLLRAEFPATELRPGTYACLDVTDTGSGMDGHTVSRIFDPFFTTKFAGRGLGLAAVSGIVRSHYGSVQVDSTPGKGSTFRVFLPASQPGPDEPKPPSPTDLYTHDTDLIRR